MPETNELKKALQIIAVWAEVQMKHHGEPDDVVLRQIADLAQEAIKKDWRDV